MRTYGQYCAVAKALDVVGERWSLLIVRELLLRPCRYGELLDGLPGIATNLLADRLRRLEEAGVVTRDEHGHYALSEWGKGLGATLRELVRWAAPLMREKGGSDVFRIRWLELPFALMFGGVDSSRPELEVEVRSGDDAITLKSVGGEIHVRTGTAESPDVVVTGPPEPIIGLLSGRLDKKAAAEQGVKVLGDIRLVERLRQRDWLHQSATPRGNPRSPRAAAGAVRNA